MPALQTLDVLTHAGAALLALTVAWPSYLVACRIHRDAPTCVRLATAWVAMAALQVGLFHVSAAAERFAFAPLATATVLLTLVTQWRWDAAGAALARRDRDAIAAAWHALGWWRVAAVLVSLPTVLRIVRALVAPPLAWDALTYHLPRAVEWVQRGTIVPLPGPDAATYYTHFPPYGEIYLAWALAATHSDAWLFAVAAWTCAGVLLGAYALARTCGATSPAAAAGAAASAAIPAVASLVSASYVDNVALATLLVSMTFVLRALASWRTSDAVAAGVTLGLLLCTKSSAFPLAAVIGAWAALAALVTRERNVARTRALALAVVAAGVVASPPLIRALLDTGNPLYPLEVSVGPLLHLPGNALLRETMAAGTVDAREVLQALFGWATWSRDYDHLGLGPAALGLIALAVVGAIRAGRAALATSTLLAVVGVAIVAPAFSPSVRSLWVFWAPASPRLVAGAVCLAAALATRSGATWMLWALAVVSAAASVPRGIGVAEWRGLAAIWPVVAVVASGALIAWRGARRQQWRRVIAACGALAVFVPAAVAPVRQRIRMAVYEEAARGEAFDLHRLALTEASAWPLWRELDQRPALRLAIAAGFTGPGHNWYRYPLYGAHYQHAVRYVPVTADGALRSYRDRTLMDSACESCWLERLRTSGIDAVVVLPPPTFEAGWARARPGEFSELALGTAAVFLVRPPAQ